MENAQILTELYEVIKQNTPDQYARIIRERASYSFLYHLSEIRQNLIGWLPIDATKRVLEWASYFHTGDSDRNAVI